MVLVAWPYPENIAQSLEVLSEIGTEATHHRRRYTDAFLLQGAEHIGHIHHVVEPHRMGHHVPILDPLCLFDRVATAQPVPQMQSSR